MTSPSASERVLLFLQGPPSFFWGELADAFAAAGARVLGVRLSAADHLYWRRPETVSYRGTLADWPDRLERLIRREGVTDILYYADRPPFHAVAAETAIRLGVAAHVIENGYLRPDWITLERDGMGVHSHFPADAEAIRTAARGLPEPDCVVRYRHRFAELATHEVAHALLQRFGGFLHPGFDGGRYYDALFEFLSWLPRIVRMRPLRRAAAEVEAWSADRRFWLVAMQLQADFQIRANSHYGHLSEMLEEVIASFAANAPAEDRLVIRLHPHDNGIERWEVVIPTIAARAGVADRVVATFGGSLDRLLERSLGVLMVNSTVGIHAIRAGKPVKVFGAAVYDIPGLTHSGPLDTFWSAPEAPDPTMVDAFLRLLAASIQVKGDFYDRAGRRAAITTIVERVLAGKVNQPGAFVDPPPRLKAFRAGARQFRRPIR